MEIRIIRSPITNKELLKIAEEKFGDFVKAVVDVEQEIIAVGGELHADGETLLMEQCSSKREYTWGINFHFKESGDSWIEFDSMINLKPSYGNRIRGIQDQKIKEKVEGIVRKLVID